MSMSFDGSGIKASNGGTVVIGGMPLGASQFDLSDHNSRVGAVRASSITLIALVAIFVSLRIFVRAYVVRRIFADDVLIMVAAIFTITLASVAIAAISEGVGTHVWLLPVAEVIPSVSHTIQLLYVCQITYTFAIAFTKLAIISSYLRFISAKGFRIAMYVIAGTIACLWVTSIFVTIFQCTPVRAAWNFFLTERRCINFVNYLYAFSAINVFTDILLVVLPWPYLWKLKMPLKQRIVLCVLFAGGTGACIAGIVRIGLLYTLRTFDLTYSCVPCLMLSVVECALGIICVSIPALRPGIVRLFPKTWKSDTSTSGNTPGYSKTHSRNLSKQQSKSANQREMAERPSFSQNGEIGTRPLDDGKPLPPSPPQSPTATQIGQAQ